MLDLIQALSALWPVIKDMIELYLGAQPSSRPDVLSRIKGAMENAKQSNGNTSQIEDLIRGGR